MFRLGKQKTRIRKENIRINWVRRDKEVDSRQFDVKLRLIGQAQPIIKIFNVLLVQQHLPQHILPVILAIPQPPLILPGTAAKIPVQVNPEQQIKLIVNIINNIRMLT